MKSFREVTDVYSRAKDRLVLSICRHKESYDVRQIHKVIHKSKESQCLDHLAMSTNHVANQKNRQKPKYEHV